jgi:hypothetical protein
LDLGETAFGFEDAAPELVELAVLGSFLGRGFDVGAFVYRVELSALDGVEEHFGRFLNTFEEAVVFGAAGCGALVWVVLEDLFAVGALDLVFGGFVAVF